MKENLVKCGRIVDKVELNDNNNEFNENCLKVFRISVECNAFDVNEDKQRQCYKQLKCFWPKCRYSCNTKRDLNRHISQHLNIRQFACDECNKQFHHKTNLLHHKRNIHRNDRSFICQRSDCNKRFKTKPELIQHYFNSFFSSEFQM